ncbi:MAG TPA: NAD(P)H-dependent glycerol-3-phosphate dehydrogenase [Candidatus Paceibacterota bacterium]|nr:NAD(P)H-dependent glycerol-3-phosphate dehydrogenase [Verrucomicrobiota bacterium]HSA13045.1 NAD(P)H-dependent glycerol-3-phosphate dehydrogenase [Candidatus Paceibacterota bacterium]
MRVTVLGAGAWGTALARLLHQGGNGVTLWGHSTEWLEEIRRTGRNERFLPGVEVPREVVLESDLPRAIETAECIVVAVPSQPFREVTRHLAAYTKLIVSVTKGIEYDTGLTMCGVLSENAPGAKCAALSGPTFAVEVARDIPTAIVAASRDATTAAQVQQLFSRPAFRVYTSTDLLGVELGGSLKNVIAIAAGVGDGLGFGDNSKAALVTRAIVEIRRLGEACGAVGGTFTGLSGLGDLMVTCFSKHSRNRGFGERVGRGEKPARIAASLLTVAEGYPTARSAFQLSRKHGVITPVIDEVYAMLYEGKNVTRAVRDLMARDPKPE